MKSLLLALAVAGLNAAAADETLVTFDGGIGSTGVGVTSTGSAALNIVRGVSPGGFPGRSRVFAAP